jgi:hypothetical protein
MKHSRLTEEQIIAIQRPRAPCGDMMAIAMAYVFAEMGLLVQSVRRMPDMSISSRILTFLPSGGICAGREAFSDMVQQRRQGR